MNALLETYRWLAPALLGCGGYGISLIVRYAIHRLTDGDDQDGGDGDGGKRKNSDRPDGDVFYAIRMNDDRRTTHRIALPDPYVVPRTFR